MKEEQKVLALLRRYYPGENFPAEGISLVHRGRFANALVFRYREGGRDWVIKDFSRCFWPIRQFFGRWAIRQEFRAMALLQGMRGVTGHVRRLGPYAVAYDFIAGETVANCGRDGVKLPVAFFEEFERMVGEMHARGLAHLDLRNMSNVLRGTDGLPWFIDFQSSVLLKSFPESVQGLLRSIDESAVFKAWMRHCSEPLPEEKKVFLDEFNRKRRFWVFRGYMLTKFFQGSKRKA